MKLKKLILLAVPFMLLGCNSSNVNSTKSPFNDSYNPIGMTGEYNITGSVSTTDYKNLKTTITKDYPDNVENLFIVSSYTKQEETRDLKAAYFGKNLGAANLCSLTHQITTNTRYSNYVTTKFSTSHKENQTVSGGINKTNPVVNDYIYQVNDAITGSNDYQINRQSWDDNEEKKTEIIKSGETCNIDNFDDVINVYGLKPYVDDAKNLSKIKVGEKEIAFEVLGDNNNAIYGKSGDKYLIKEAISIFEPYSTVVGDTYKAVYNFFYETLLEKVGEDSFRFTNFRFYKELLILSEAVSDEKTVPVLYLEKPQRVEYSEIKYTISYVDDMSKLETYTKGNIPQPK